MSTKLDRNKTAAPTAGANNRKTGNKTTTRKVTAKTVSKKKATAKKKTVKKAAAARRAPSAAIIMPNPIKRQTAIEKIAYHLSEARGFAPGFEESDWLTAETIIERLHSDD